MTPIKILTPEEMRSEPDVPQTLYKYREWANDFHKSILVDQIVYLSSPEEFEDPIDCKMPVRYDLLSADQILELYYKLSKEDHPNWTSQEHRAFARKWAKNTPFKNPTFYESHQKQFFEGFFKRMGVLCLTAEPANILMWEKYSDDHKGFCVGFNMPCIYENLGGSGEVGYFEELPIISPMMDFGEQHFLQVLSKEKKWGFEKEYRTYKFWENGALQEDRLYKLPKDCFKAVIFGARMTEEHKNEIIQICKNQRLPVIFLQVVINPEVEGLSIAPVFG